MIKTYVRPIWLSALMILGYSLSIEAIVLLMGVFLVPLMIGAENANRTLDSIFGPVPAWTAIPAAFTLICPFFGLLMFSTQAPKVYSKELNKNLFPMFPDSDQMMIYPHKAKNKDGKMVHPEWVEDLPDFEASLTYTGDFPGVDGAEMLKDEESGIAYMMTNLTFRKIAKDMINGKITKKWKRTRLSYQYFGVEPSEGE